jgi:hypothetical protein
MDSSGSKSSLSNRGINCFSYPRGVLRPMILYFPSIGGLKNSAPTVLMAKMFSLGDSLKSHLKIGVIDSFSFNWPVVGRAGDSECRGFPFPIVRLGDKDLFCTSAGLAERARCGRTWEVRSVLPPSGVASWDARVRARDPWRGEFWLDPALEPPAVLRAFSRTHHQGWWVPTSWRGC